MINITGKAIPEKVQLENCVRDGFSAIELQLYGDFVEKSNEEIIDLVKSVEGLSIHSVHSPILQSRELEIEDLGDSNTIFPILKTFYLADLLSGIYKMSMPVVVHATSNMESLLVKKDLLYRIVRELDIALNLFPNIQVCIENTIPVISKGDRYETKNSFLYDTVEICKFLRNQLKSDRIFTVLDTCHAMTSIRFMKETQNYTNTSTATIEDFFIENGEYARIIHLNNVIEMGLKKGQHSTPFLPNNVEDNILLKHITDHIIKYTPNATCVLELNEEEYVVNSNANKLLTLETLRKLGVEYRCL